MNSKRSRTVKEILMVAVVTVAVAGALSPLFAHTNAPTTGCASNDSCGGDHSGNNPGGGGNFGHWVGWVTGICEECHIPRGRNPSSNPNKHKLSLELKPATFWRRHDALKRGVKPGSGIKLRRTRSIKTDGKRLMESR